MSDYINSDLLGMLTQFTLNSTLGGLGTLGAAVSTLGTSLKPNTGNATLDAIQSFTKNVNPMQMATSGNTSKANDYLKTINESLQTVVSRIETTNSLLQKIIDIQTGVAPIDFQKTIKRNNRMALMMSRTALGKLTLATMSDALGASGARYENITKNAINTGQVSKQELVFNKLLANIPLIGKLVSNIDAVVDSVLFTKSEYTQESNITLTQIIPERLQVIGHFNDMIHTKTDHIDKQLTMFTQMTVSYYQDMSNIITQTQQFYSEMSLFRATYYSFTEGFHVKFSRMHKDMQDFYEDSKNMFGLYRDFMMTSYDIFEEIEQNIYEEYNFREQTFNFYSRMYEFINHTFTLYDELHKYNLETSDMLITSFPFFMDDTLNHYKKVEEFQAQLITEQRWANQRLDIIAAATSRGISEQDLRDEKNRVRRELHYVRDQLLNSILKLDVNNNDFGNPNIDFHRHRAILARDHVQNRTQPATVATNVDRNNINVQETSVEPSVNNQTNVYHQVEVNRNGQTQVVNITFLQNLFRDLFRELGDTIRNALASNSAHSAEIIANRLGDAIRKALASDGPDIADIIAHSVNVQEKNKNEAAQRGNEYFRKYYESQEQSNLRRNALLTTLNNTASNTLNNMVNLRAAFISYFSKLPNLLPRIVNTVIKLTMGFGLARIIYNSITMLFYKGKAPTDGIIGWIGKIFSATGISSIIESIKEYVVLGLKSVWNSELIMYFRNSASEIWTQIKEPVLSGLKTLVWKIFSNWALYYKFPVETYRWISRDLGRTMAEGSVIKNLLYKFMLGTPGAENAGGLVGLAGHFLGAVLDIPIAGINGISRYIFGSNLIGRSLYGPVGRVLSNTMGGILRLIGGVLGHLPQLIMGGTIIYKLLSDQSEKWFQQFTNEQQEAMLRHQGKFGVIGMYVEDMIDKTLDKVGWWLSNLGEYIISLDWVGDFFSLSGKIYDKIANWWKGESQYSQSQTYQQFLKDQQKKQEQQNKADKKNEEKREEKKVSFYDTIASTLTSLKDVVSSGFKKLLDFMKIYTPEAIGTGIGMVEQAYMGLYSFFDKAGAAKLEAQNRTYNLNQIQLLKDFVLKNGLQATDFSPSGLIYEDSVKKIYDVIGNAFKDNPNLSIFTDKSGKPITGEFATRETLARVLQILGTEKRSVADDVRDGINASELKKLKTSQIETNTTDILNAIKLTMSKEAQEKLEKQHASIKQFASGTLTSESHQIVTGKRDQTTGRYSGGLLSESLNDFQLNQSNSIISQIQDLEKRIASTTNASEKNKLSGKLEDLRTQLTHSDIGQLRTETVLRSLTDESNNGNVDTNSTYFKELVRAGSQSNRTASQAYLLKTFGIENAEGKASGMSTITDFMGLEGSTYANEGLLSSKGENNDWLKDYINPKTKHTEETENLFKENLKNLILRSHINFNDVNEGPLISDIFNKDIISNFINSIPFTNNDYGKNAQLGIYAVRELLSLIHSTYSGFTKGIYTGFGDKEAGENFLSLLNQANTADSLIGTLNPNLKEIAKSGIFAHPDELYIDIMKKGFTQLITNADLIKQFTNPEYYEYNNNLNEILGLNLAKFGLIFGEKIRNAYPIYNKIQQAFAGNRNPSAENQQSFEDSLNDILAYMIAIPGFYGKKDDKTGLFEFEKNIPVSSITTSINNIKETLLDKILISPDKDISQFGTLNPLSKYKILPEDEPYTVINKLYDLYKILSEGDTLSNQDAHWWNHFTHYASSHDRSKKFYLDYFYYNKDQLDHLLQLMDPNLDKDLIYEIVKQSRKLVRQRIIADELRSNPAGSWIMLDNIRDPSTLSLDEIKKILDQERAHESAHEDTVRKYYNPSNPQYIPNMVDPSIRTEEGDGGATGGSIIPEPNPSKSTTQSIIEDLDNKKAKIKIIQALVRNNHAWKDKQYMDKIKGLMLHSVGTGNPNALYHIKKDLLNPDRTKAVAYHGIIDTRNGNIYQTLPWNLRGWHSGHGPNGNANDNYIGIEMTESDLIKYSKGAQFTIADKNLDKVKSTQLNAYNSAVDLFAYLSDKYNLDPLGKNVIISHNEGNKLGIASNHVDPEHLWSKLGFTMDKFRQDVNSKKLTLYNTSNYDKYRFQINKADHTLSVYKGNSLIKTYSVTTGINPGPRIRPNDKTTPEGNFTITSIENSSTWLHDYNDGKGKVKAYGPWFLRLNDGPTWSGIGIHGTSRPEMIGKNDSLGCIRLLNNDITELKEKYATIGTPVDIFDIGALNSINTNNSTESIMGYANNLDSNSITGPKEWTKYIFEYGKKYNIDPELISALIMAESAGKPNAISKSGARGLMQIMPIAEDDIKKRLHLNNYDIFNPETNIMMGVDHLAWTRDEVKRLYPEASWIDIIRAYNKGASGTATWAKNGRNLNELKKEQLEYPFRVLNNYGKHNFVPSNTFIQKYLYDLREQAAKEASKQLDNITRTIDLANYYLTANNKYMVFDGERPKSQYHLLHPVLRDRIGRYAKAFYEQKGKPIVITSTYRSFEQQKALYDAWIKRGKTGYPVGKPSMYNRHTIGTAIDLSVKNGSIDDTLLNKFHLKRPWPNSDAVHVELEENVLGGGKVVHGSEVIKRFGNYPSRIAAGANADELSRQIFMGQYGNVDSYGTPIDLNYSHENNEDQPPENDNTFFGIFRKVLKDVGLWGVSPVEAAFNFLKLGGLNISEEAGDYLPKTNYYDTTKYFNPNLSLLEVGDAPSTNAANILRNEWAIWNENELQRMLTYIRNNNVTDDELNTITKKYGFVSDYQELKEIIIELRKEKERRRLIDIRNDAEDARRAREAEQVQRRRRNQYTTDQVTILAERAQNLRNSINNGINQSNRNAANAAGIGNLGDLRRSEYNTKDIFQYFLKKNGITESEWQVFLNQRDKNVEKKTLEELLEEFKEFKKKNEEQTSQVVKNTGKVANNTNSNNTPNSESGGTFSDALKKAWDKFKNIDLFSKEFWTFDSSKSNPGRFASSSDKITRIIEDAKKNPTIANTPRFKKLKQEWELGLGISKNDKAWLNSGFKGDGKLDYGISLAAENSNIYHNPNARGAKLDGGKFYLQNNLDPIQQIMAGKVLPVGGSRNIGPIKINSAYTSGNQIFDGRKTTMGGIGDIEFAGINMNRVLGNDYRHGLHGGEYDQVGQTINTSWYKGDINPYGDNPVTRRQAGYIPDTLNTRFANTIIKQENNDYNHPAWQAAFKRYQERYGNGIPDIQVVTDIKKQLEESSKTITTPTKVSTKTVTNWTKEPGADVLKRYIKAHPREWEAFLNKYPGAKDKSLSEVIYEFRKFNNTYDENRFKKESSKTITTHSPNSNKATREAINRQNNTYLNIPSKQNVENINSRQAIIAARDSQFTPSPYTVRDSIRSRNPILYEGMELGGTDQAMYKVIKRKLDKGQPLSEREEKWFTRFKERIENRKKFNITSYRKRPTPTKTPQEAIRDRVEAEKTIQDVKNNTPVESSFKGTFLEDFFGVFGASVDGTPLGNGGLDDITRNLPNLNDTEIDMASVKAGLNAHAFKVASKVNVGEVNKEWQLTFERLTSTIDQNRVMLKTLYESIRDGKLTNATVATNNNNIITSNTSTSNVSSTVDGTSTSPLAMTPPNTTDMGIASLYT